MAFIKINKSDSTQESSTLQQKKSVQFADNRSSISLQLKLQNIMQLSAIKQQKLIQTKPAISPIYKKSSTAIQKVAKVGNVVQRGKKLKDASKILDMEKIKTPESRRMFRTLLLNRLRNKKYIKRNKLAFTLNVNGLNVTIHLDSRGLGGRHPIYKDKSSSHTEQIVRAIMGSRKKDLVNILNKKLKRRKKSQIVDFDSSVKLTSIISSNSPCNSNAGDHEHGCGGIETEALGMGNGIEMHYLRQYQGEDKEENKTDFQGMKEFMGKAKSLKDFKDDDSSDEELDTEDLRGKDIAVTPLTFMDSPDIKENIATVKSGKNKGEFKLDF